MDGGTTGMKEKIGILERRVRELKDKNEKKGEEGRKANGKEGRIDEKIREMKNRLEKKEREERRKIEGD